MTNFDVAIIGAGIAGASAAYEIAATHSVLLLEAEEQPGYHTTGRSAALFTETYGNTLIQGLTTGSRAFYEDPPPPFGGQKLLSPRGVAYVARVDQVARLESHVARVRTLAPATRMVEASELLRLVPILRPDYVAAGAVEPDAMDIDTAALHAGYLRGARQRGAVLACDARVDRLEREGAGWRLAAGEARWTAGVVVNAAGAWGDVTAAMMGAAPVGLQPKRRTALMLDPPAGADPARWPMVTDADESFYFKPDAGRLLASPADETPMHPHDVQPDELDIAICIDRVQQAADLPVSRVHRAWAGLRSFAPDKTPVVGFDPAVDGLFWLVGQGGYGFQTAPAMGRTAAALLRGEDVPGELRARGVSAAALSPARFAQALQAAD